MTCFNYKEPPAPAHHSFNKRQGTQRATATRTYSVFKQTNQCRGTHTHRNTSVCYTTHVVTPEMQVPATSNLIYCRLQLTPYILPCHTTPINCKEDVSPNLPVSNSSQCAFFSASALKLLQINWCFSCEINQSPVVLQGNQADPPQKQRY